MSSSSNKYKNKQISCKSIDFYFFKKTNDQTLLKMKKLKLIASYVRLITYMLLHRNFNNNVINMR